MPFKTDENGEEWYYFGPGDYLELNIATGEMEVKFSWWDWIKHHIAEYFLPMGKGVVYEKEYYDNDTEWCDTVLSHTWLPFPVAEWVTRIQLGRWNKEMEKHDK